MSKSEATFDFLGLGSARIVLNHDGHVTDRSGHHAGGEDSHGVGGTGDLLEEGSIIKDGVVSADLDRNIETNKVSRVDFSLLDKMSGENSLVSSRDAGRLNGFNGLLESVGLDGQVEQLNFLLDFFRGLDSDGDLSFLAQDNLGFKGKSRMEGKVNSSTNVLLGERRDNTHMGLDLNIHDGVDLAQQDRGERHLRFNSDTVVGLEDTLDGEDNGSRSFQVDGETTITGSDDLDIIKLLSLGVFILHAFTEELGVASELFSNSFHGFKVEFRVERQDSFKTHELEVEVSLRSEHLTLLDLELLVDLLKFRSD